MNIKFLLILSMSYSVVWGQTTAMNPNPGQQEITLRKQIIIDDLENQIKDTPLVAVRVLARYKIASSLWRSGKDETGRAEQLTIKALDELYEKRAEIPSLYFRSLSSSIFALLETNAKDLAKKFRAKYNLSSEDELQNAYSLLDAKDGEKIAADKIQRSLANQTELSSLTILLMDDLQNRNSPELLRILTEIVNLEESCKSNFSAESLFFVVDFFRDAGVSRNLRTRFYNMVCNKAKTAIPAADSDPKSVYDLLSAIMQDVAKNAPDLLPEASTLQSVFRSRVPPVMVESKEAYRRIGESRDQLNALISEAEASDNKGFKADLLSQAAQLALKKGKFRLAVELVDKAKANIDEEKDKRFALWYDQFLSEVSDSALKEADLDSYKYATERVINKLTLANVLRATALYYYEKRDSVSAAEALDRSLKLAANADHNLPKVYLLVRLISAAQKVDPNRVPEVIENAAKAINGIPRLDVDDKPETDKYKKYVNSIMSVNELLMPVFDQLVKRNKTEAIDLAARINMKEIKLMLNYIFLIDSLHPESEPRY
jgi:hypothetical protein